MDQLVPLVPKEKEVKGVNRDLEDNLDHRVRRVNKVLQDYQAREESLDPKVRVVNQDYKERLVLLDQQGLVVNQVVLEHLVKGDNLVKLDQLVQRELQGPWGQLGLLDRVVK